MTNTSEHGPVPAIPDDAFRDAFSRSAKLARDIDWNLFKVFFFISANGGVSKAAAQMFRQQPAVSQALRRLEKHIGSTLCHRGPSGFALTAEGELMARMCHEMYESVFSIPDDIEFLSGKFSGALRIQIVSNLVSPLLDRTIADFHRRYPRVEIDLNVSSWETVETAVLRGQAEIGVGPTRFPNRDLRYRLLCRELHRVYCGRRHKLYGQKAMSFDSLADEALVLTGDDEPEQITEFRLRHGLGRHVSGKSEHIEEAVRLIVQGVGVGFLPEPLVGDLIKSGDLHAVSPNSQYPTMEIYVISNPESPRSQIANLFLFEFTRQQALLERTEREAANAEEDLDITSTV